MLSYRLGDTYCVYCGILYRRRRFSVTSQHNDDRNKKKVYLFYANIMG